MSELGYTPSALMALITSRSQTPVVQSSRGIFSELTPATTHTASWNITLWSRGRTRMAHCARRQISLWLHGEVYDAGDAPERHLLEQYHTQGPRFAADMHASAAVLVVDAAADRVLLITDRVNSRKVYHTRLAVGHCLTTTLAALPREGLKPDPAGVAWYLSHQAIHNRRTCYRDVRVLRRACVHQLTPAGFEAEPYWSYDFHSLSHASERDLSAELEERLIASARSHLGQTQNPFLSLSAGYDATGILGTLGLALKTPGVQCFSYGGHDSPPPHSDEHAAQQMAHSLGYTHRCVRGYRGDLPGHLRRNALLGQGVATPCDEIDAWRTLAAEEFSRSPGSVLFVGDECLGWTDYLLRNPEEALAAVQIGPAQTLAGVLPLFADSTGIAETLHEDTRQILAACPPAANLHDTKDFLYLDQRMPGTIMNWRERFAGLAIEMRNPLLDNRILDFMKKVPTRLRLQKCLYRRTMHRMFAPLFRVNRARFGTYALHLSREMIKHRDALIDMVRSESSLLDELIDPQRLIEQLHRLQDPTALPPSPAARMRSLIKTAANRSGVKNYMRGYLRPALAPPSALAMLWRCLILRTAMTPACAAWAGL